MDEIIKKISSYNVFSRLFPGIVFYVLINEFTSFSLPQCGILESMFIYYFLGMCMDRVGSLVMEPILKKIEFIKFSSYEDYIESSKNDNEIKTLEEISKAYRSMLSVFIVFLIIKIYEQLTNYCIFFEYAGYIIIFVTLIVMFLYSYKKQINYVGKRIDKYKKDNQNGNS